MKVNELIMAKELGKNHPHVRQQRDIKDKIVQLFTKNTAQCRYKSISILCESCPMVNR